MDHQFYARYGWCENAVQTGLDKLNAENIQIGLEAFERDGNDHASRSTA